MIRKTTGYLGAAMTTVLLASTAISTSSLAQAQVLEEIIVTAQKREQSLQDVSVSVTALSGEMINDFGFQDTLNIFNQIPNVNANQFSFSGGLTIRGNATLNSTLAGEGNVALYFDDVYRPTAYYGGNEMLDVERVEVLRGPQGTLFGRNATAGLVHFISRKPTDELEGYGTLEYGSNNRRIFESAVGGPLSDRIRGRLAFKYHEDDGIQDNLGPAGGKLGVTNRLMGRAHLEFDVSEKVNLMLSLEISDADDIGKGFNYWGLLDPAELALGNFVQCEAARIHAGECVGGSGFGDPDLDPTKVYTELDPNNGENRYTLETLTAIAKLTWQLNDTTELVSITAFDTHDRSFNADEDASVDGVAVWGVSFNDTYTSDTDQFTQELRLSGVNGGIDWLIGAFYFDEDRQSTSTIADFEFGLGPDTVVQLDTKSWAVFGQVGKTLSDTMRVFGGLRYTDDDKSTSLVTAGVPGSQQLGATNVSGKVGLEWRPQDDVMIYGSFSTGFRAGNFNTDLLFGDITALTAVDPEKVQSYELGIKSTLMDGRMRLNAALFRQDISDKQGVVFDNPAAPVGRLISVGDADIFGAELELSLLPVENLELSLGVGWLDTEIDTSPDFFVSANFGAGANAWIGDTFFLDGSALGGGAPKWTINGMARYDVELGSNGIVTLQADFAWREETNGLGGNPVTVSESRTLTNLRVFWRSPSERWEVQAHVENVANTRYIDNIFALAGVDYAYGNMGLPRRYGVKVGVNF